MICDKISHMSEMSVSAVSKNTASKKKRFYLRMPRGYDLPIHICTIALMIFGVVMVASASMGQAVGNNKYIYLTVGKQTAFVIFGYILMINIAHWFKLKMLSSSKFPVFLLVMMILLISTVFFDAGGGSHAWLRFPLGPLGEITVQPSEFAKTASFLCIAAYCGDIHRQNLKGWDIFKKPLFFILAYVLIVTVVEGDAGSAAVILFISYICMLVPSHPAFRKLHRWMVVMLIAGIAGLVILFSPLGSSIISAIPDSLMKPYQKQRFYTALNPFSDPYGNGYQLVFGLTSFAAGGWFGRGLGNSIRKYMTFPAANTDYILAITVEEFGYIGFLVLIILYAVIILRLLMYAIKIPSEKSKIILTGTAMYFLIHLILNIGGVTGMIPLTGVPLLLMSYGGTSAVSILCALGLCQAVIRSYRKAEAKK